MSKKAASVTAANSLLKLIVPAGKATPSPPIGPALGQRGVRSVDFCKQFNDRTKDFIVDTPLPVVINIKPDRTFTFIIKSPPTSHLLKKAAGVEKGSAKTGHEFVGKLSLKHVYEIGKVKAKDEGMQDLGLERVCAAVQQAAKTAGIQIVP